MSDFFEVDKVYVANNPYRAPEINEEFWCKTVLEHPTMGTKWAVGWVRGGHFSNWDYGLSAYGSINWTDGQWVESPFENPTAVETDE